jgi:hypothetical protein
MAEMMGDHCVTAELLGRTLKPAESTVRDSSITTTVTPRTTIK